MQRTQSAKWVLVAGLVFVFGYFGIDKFLNPLVWIVWMPTWMDGLMGMPKDTWLQIMGVLEMVMAVLVLLPMRRVQQLGVMLMAVHMLGILSQVGWNDIAIRDIGLLATMGALFLLL